MKQLRDPDIVQQNCSVLLSCNALLWIAMTYLDNHVSAWVLLEACNTSLRTRLAVAVRASFIDHFLSLIE